MSYLFLFQIPNNSGFIYSVHEKNMRIFAPLNETNIFIFNLTLFDCLLKVFYNTRFHLPTLLFSLSDAALLSSPCCAYSSSLFFFLLFRCVLLQDVFYIINDALIFSTTYLTIFLCFSYELFSRTIKTPNTPHIIRPCPS